MIHLVNQPTAALVISLVLGSCAQPGQSGLGVAEARQCQAKGGVEGTGSYGIPYCRIPYIDAGKKCAGKSDCMGRCLSFPADGDTSASVKVGTPVVGSCEAEQATYGCYGPVEAGRLADP